MAATEFQYHRPTRRPLRPRAVRPWARASVRSPSERPVRTSPAASVSRTVGGQAKGGPGAGPGQDGPAVPSVTGGSWRGFELVAEGLALDLGAAEDGGEVGDEDQLGGTFVVGEVGGLGEDLVAEAWGGAWSGLSRMAATTVWDPGWPRPTTPQLATAGWRRRAASIRWGKTAPAALVILSPARSA